MRRVVILLSFIITSLLFSSVLLCQSNETLTCTPYDASIAADHPFGFSNVLRDYYPTEEWRSCTPEEQGMNSSLLSEMLPYIIENEWAFDSIIIVRGGYIVYEEYPNPDYPMSYFHTLQSVTKSFTSALVGCAIKEGLLTSVDEKIVDLFNDRTISNLDERKERITVEHLLTMTAGIEWDEWTYPYTDTVNNNLAAMSVSDDGVDYFLNLPMIAEPGELWTYNGGGIIVLGALIEKLSNMTLLDFAETYLFHPIGIPGGGWLKQSSGYYEAGGGLYLKPRDMARFGYLYLNGGMWNESEVIPLEWVLNSTEYHTISPRYGYLWWLEPGMNAYVASGRLGQKIIVCPDEDLVVVFTASIYEMYEPHYDLYYDYIKAAIIGPPRIVEPETTTYTTTNQTFSDQTSSLLDGSTLALILITSTLIFAIVAIVILFRRHL